MTERDRGRLGHRPGHAAPATACSTLWYPDPRLGRATRRPGTEPLAPRALARTSCAASASARSPPSIDDLAEPPADAADAYLRLHLLSHRLIRPHEANLDGIFGVLPNVAWTSHGPGRPGRAGRRAAALPRRRAPLAGHRGRQVPADDRLRRARPACGSPTPTASGSAPTSPRARPSCTRASSTSTPARSAPRWSRAASAPAWWSATAPTSAAAPRSWARCRGGGTEVISVGERCLLGANSGLGISLGDDCVVEAGPLRDRRHARDAARRRGRQGARAERRERPAVPPQLADRRRRGGAAHAAPGAASTPRCTPTSDSDRASSSAARSQSASVGTSASPHVALAGRAEVRARRDDDARARAARGEPSASRARASQRKNVASPPALRSPRASSAGSSTSRLAAVALAHLLDVRLVAPGGRGRALDELLRRDADVRPVALERGDQLAGRRPRSPTGSRASTSAWRAC